LGDDSLEGGSRQSAVRVHIARRVGVTLFAPKFEGVIMHRGIEYTNVISPASFLFDVGNLIESRLKIDSVTR
jgi:hypothetical protein